MRLSIIIPVYNEEQTISELVERVRAVDLGVIEKEIIIANDGSSDRTREVINSSEWAGDPRIRIYDYPINVGKGAAVRLGLKFATGDIVIIQDADLELNPQEYSILLAPVLAGETDVVYGSRFLKPTHRIPLRTRAANWSRRIGAAASTTARLSRRSSGDRAIASSPAAATRRLKPGLVAPELVPLL